MVDTWLTPKKKSTAESTKEKSTTKPTGLMLPEPSESEIKASELLGDTEYELYFRELLDKSPLFKLGFDPKHIYYQRESNIPEGAYTTKAGTYYPQNATLEYLEKRAINPNRSSIGRNVHREIAQAIKRKEIPEGDFIFMRGFMLPGDITTDYPLGASGMVGLDKSHESSLHMHEFIHRALNTIPQLKEWKENNDIDSRDEELMMSVFTTKYFPDMSEFEIDRMKENYGIDITKNYNKNKISNWVNEVENIANNILENKGVKVIKPKIKPKPKPKSIMDKEKIIPKIKPKPEQEKKQRTWMEIIKGLFK